MGESEPPANSPVLPTNRPIEAAAVDSGGFGVATESQWRTVLRRFRRNKLAVVGLVVLVVVIVSSLAGSSLWTYKFDEITTDRGQSPSVTHPMGTDDLGKDLLAKTLRGSQKSVQIMLIVALVSTTIGVVIGAVAGYYRRWIDAVAMRFIDLLLTIPTIAVLGVLANLAVQNSQGSAPKSNSLQIAVIIGLLSWMPLARLVRAEVLSLREKEFVEAARALGANDRRIIFRHILPNAMGTIIVSATLTMAAAILIETALTFIGLGIRAPDTSLGLLVSDGQSAFTTRPWLFWTPGIVIVVIVLSVNFVGDGLRDAFDPRQTRVRA